MENVVTDAPINKTVMSLTKESFLIKNNLTVKEIDFRNL
jgi:hypothetical protein